MPMYTGPPRVVDGVADDLPRRDGSDPLVTGLSRRLRASFPQPACPFQGVHVRGTGAAYAPGVRSASTSLPGQPGSVPTARRWARSTLASWGHPDAGWSAAQIVSELATNVALHARSAFTVTLLADDDCVRLEVSDGSPVSLQTRQYGLTATTGRGLHIVESLCADWGVTTQADGKTVWVLLRLDGAQDDDATPGATVGRRTASRAQASPFGTVALRRSA